MKTFQTIYLPAGTSVTTAKRKQLEQVRMGYDVKLMRSSGVATVPGRGITTFCNYSIQAR